MPVGFTTIVGEVRMWAGGHASSDAAITYSNPATVQEVKPGWLLCNGAVFSNATYPTLAAELGSAFNLGDEGGGNTRLPNMAQRVPLGRSLASPGATLGEKGGTLTETLTTTQIPLHAHIGTTGLMNSNATHSHVYTLFALPVPQTAPTQNALFTGGAGSAGPVAPSTNATDTNHTHDFSTSSVGGGGSHNNVPLYLTLHFIIKF